MEFSELPRPDPTTVPVYDDVAAYLCSTHRVQERIPEYNYKEGRVWGGQNSSRHSPPTITRRRRVLEQHSCAVATPVESPHKNAKRLFPPQRMPRLRDPLEQCLCQSAKIVHQSTVFQSVQIVHRGPVRRLKHVSLHSTLRGRQDVPPRLLQIRERVQICLLGNTIRDLVARLRVLLHRLPLPALGQVQRTTASLLQPFQKQVQQKTNKAGDLVVLLQRDDLNHVLGRHRSLVAWSHIFRRSHEHISHPSSNPLRLVALHRDVLLVDRGVVYGSMFCAIHPCRVEAARGHERGLETKIRHCCRCGVAGDLGIVDGFDFSFCGVLFGRIFVHVVLSDTGRRRHLLGVDGVGFVLGAPSGVFVGPQPKVVSTKQCHGQQHQQHRQDSEGGDQPFPKHCPTSH